MAKTSISKAQTRVLLTRHVPYIIDQFRQKYPEIKLDVFEHDDRVMPREDLLARVKDCNGLLCMLTDTIDDKVLTSAGPSLNVVSTMSVGYNHINISDCVKRNVLVGYTPGVLDNSTAETAVALTFLTRRRILECVDAAKTGKWGVWNPFEYCGYDLTGSTIGIVGLGRIGARYARMMKDAFACKVVYFGPRPKETVASTLDAEYCSIEKLLQVSDIVSVHCPLSDSTNKMFDLKLFQLMKSNAVFINTSRGGVVDQDALYEALKSGLIGGAGLDVTDPEPLPPSHQLYSLPNCTILPHIGSATIATRKAMADIAFENVIAGVYNKPLKHQV